MTYASPRTKACPICGDDKVAIEHTYTEDGYSLKIHCMECGLSKTSEYKAAKPFDQAMRETIEYWNNRKKPEGCQCGKCANNE